MNMAKLSPVSLFLVCVHVVATSNVEPPVNVTLHCHNLHNIVEWSYGPSQPGLKFKVFIGGIQSPPNELLVDPQIQQADISHLSDPSDDYLVSVSAVVEKKESDPAPPDGITFSYFMDSQAQQKCFLDFPSVNVTAKQDGKALVRFIHPWMVYHHKLPGTSRTNSQKMRRHDAQMNNQPPEFKYDVVINNKEQPETFFCGESVCEAKLSVDPAQKRHCLKVSGEMQKILVRGTQEYCAIPSHKQKGNVYIIIGVVIPLALIMFGIVLFMVYKKKTRPSTSLPNAMTFNSRVKQTLRLVREPVSVPEIGSTSPTPLLPDKEEKGEKEPKPTETSSTEHVLCEPTGLSVEDEGVCDFAEEEGSDEGTGYRQGRNLDEEETSSSGDPTGYEKRPVLVELAPDEQAEGYRG